MVNADNDLLYETVRLSLAILTDLIIYTRTFFVILKQRKIWILLVQFIVNFESIFWRDQYSTTTNASMLLCLYAIKLSSWKWHILFFHFQMLWYYYSFEVHLDTSNEKTYIKTNYIWLNLEVEFVNFSSEHYYFRDFGVIIISTALHCTMTP